MMPGSVNPYADLSPQADPRPAWARTLNRWVYAPWFRHGILGVILLAAVVVGLETSPYLMAHYGTLLKTLDAVILWIFVAEAALKIAQHERWWYRYFRDPWNLFDFFIVVVCFIPTEDAHYAAILRLARILRALRLVTAIPRLQLLVSCLLKSIPSMGYVSVLLGLLFYVYGVAGVFLFRDNDPVHFGDLGTSLLTLFRVVTLEDWTDVMYTQMYGSDVFPPEGAHDVTMTPNATPLLGAAYFVTFVLFGTMIVLNLFIGVIINSMEEAQDERQKQEYAMQRAKQQGLTVVQEVEELERKLDEFREQVHLLKGHLQVAAERRRS